MVAAIGADQQQLLPPRRLPFPAFADWTPTHLCSSDHGVLEATTSAWHPYDQLVALVASVQVANPSLVKAISSAKIKTDARDTLMFARLRAACEQTIQRASTRQVPRSFGIPGGRARLPESPGQPLLEPAALLQRGVLEAGLEGLEPQRL